MTAFEDLSPYVGPIAEGVTLTLAITFVSFSVGIVLGLPIALARLSKHRLLRWPAVAYIEFLRAVPPLAWLFMIYFGVASDLVRLDVLTASIVALGLIATAYLAEIYRAGIQAVPRGQLEAARAIGLREAKILPKIVAPQALIVAVPPGGTYLIGLLKDSSLASIIGAREITFRANIEATQSFRALQVFLVAALFYLALSLPLALAIRTVDKRLRAYLLR